MRGFAYPNVEFMRSDLYRFIGCGRYRASPQGPETKEAPAGPNVGNLAQLLAAVDALLAERTTSEARIYERRDEPEDYQGDSLAHAYFLALIHRVRCVRQPFQNLEGDIWCTGAIQLGLNRAPLLTEVEQSGFDVKLQAFLSTANHDRVFLVPAAHLTPENMYLCRNPREATFESAQTLTPSKWYELLRHALPEAFSQKVVVGIHAHELPLLVDILFESPADPDITHWFTALKTLRAEKQITDERYWEVLEYALGHSLPRSIPDAELMRELATQRERLYLKNETKEEELIKIRLREAPTTRVHQVLVAIRLGLKVIRTECGIRFVLIPTGTVSDGTVNEAPYYLAETPINEADWARILGDALYAAPHAERARVNITLSDIQRFLGCANEQLGDRAKFVIPSSKQWRFAVSAGGTVDIPRRETLTMPMLRTAQPSALDLYDVCGVVSQLCHRGKEYVWEGGSYRRPLNDFPDSLGVPPPVRLTTTFAKNLEWGFRPALDVLENARSS